MTVYLLKTGSFKALCKTHGHDTGVKIISSLFIFKSNVGIKTYN